MLDRVLSDRREKEKRRRRKKLWEGGCSIWQWIWPAPLCGTGLWQRQVCALHLHVLTVATMEPLPCARDASLRFTVTVGAKVPIGRRTRCHVLRLPVLPKSSLPRQGRRLTPLEVVSVYQVRKIYKVKKKNNNNNNNNNNKTYRPIQLQLQCGGFFHAHTIWHYSFHPSLAPRWCTFLRRSIHGIRWKQPSEHSTVYSLYG